MSTSTAEVPKIGDLPRAAVGLLAMELVSAIGSGLVLPFITIYLHQVRYLSAGATGGLLVAAAAAGLVGALAVGRLEDRLSPRLLAQAGLVAQGVGFLLIGLSASLPVAILVLAFALNGLGAGTTNPMLGVILSRTAPKELHTLAFSASHWILNLGIGVGSVAGGFGLVGMAPDRFAVLFVLNAATFVALAVGMTLLPQLQAHGEPAPDLDVAVPKAPTTPTRHGYVALLMQPAIVLILLVQLASEGLGFYQLDSALPLLLSDLAFSPASIGVLIGINTLAVILLQIPLSRWTQPLERWTVLAWQSGIWLVGYAVAFAATGRHQSWSFAVLAVFFVLFAVGECLYSSALMPLVNQSLSDTELGRAFSLLTLVSSTSKLAGPPLGLLLVSASEPRVLWLVMAGGAVVGLVGSLVIGRVSRGPA